MSVDFSNSSTDGYQNTGADAYPSRQAWSWCGWIKLDDTSGVGYITFIGGGVYYEGFYFSGSQVYADTDGGGGLLATPAVTTWRFFAGKFDGSTPYLYWADWGDASLSSGTASPNASTAFTTDTIIFSDSGSDDNALGGLAYAFRWWDAVLTEEEFESERYSAVPYRKQDLTHFLPLLVQSSDPLDFAAASGSWNSSGSPATALDNPPVGWGYSPSGLSIPASAGGATVTVAGTATAAPTASAELTVDSPAFPDVQATNNSTGSGTSHTVSLPSGISVGDLLVCFFATDGDNTITNWGGFTEIHSASNGTAASLHVAYKIAVGSDTLTVTTSSSEVSAHITYRITGHDTVQMPEASTGAQATTQYPDPDSLDPTGDAKDFLWIAVMGNDRTATTTVYPTNFDDDQVANSEGSNGGCNVAACTYSNNATTMNPGQFTMSAVEQWCAVTVAVHPPAGAVQDVTGTATAAVTVPTTKLSLLLGLEGTATATATVTAVPTRKRGITSTVTAAGTATAVLAVRASVPVVGTATVTASVTAVLKIDRLLASTVTSTATATAALVRKTPLTGTADATASVTASLGLTLPLVSTVTAVGSVVGVLDVSAVGAIELVAGTATATGSVTGVLNFNRILTSTATATGSTTATLTRMVTFTGTGTATATATATLSTDLSVASYDIHINVTVSAVLNLNRILTSTATAIGTATAALVTKALLPSGTATAVGSATATLALTLPLTATVTAVGSVVGVLDVAGTELLAGTATATGSVTASLGLTLPLEGTTTAAGSAIATLVVGIELVGSATATGSADADLHVDRQLTATASVVATATADLALDIGLVSTVTAAGSVVGVLDVTTTGATQLVVGTTTAAGSVTTSLHVDRLIVSTVTAAASVTAVLDLTIGLVSTVTATGTASAVLSVDVGVTMVGTATASVTVSPDLTMVYAMTTTVTAYGFASAALTGGSIPGGPAAAPVTRQWSAVGYGRRRC